MSTGILESDIYASLERRGVRDVWIIGGTNAIPSSVSSSLPAGITAHRIGGNTRFDTAVLVAAEVEKLPGRPLDRISLPTA